MKTWIALLAVCCLLGSAQFAKAAPAERVEARAAASCGEWIDHRKKSDTLALSNTSWLVGYLSGLAAGSGRNFLPGNENTEIFSWMDNYCRSNPLTDIAVGGSSLMAELVAKKAGRK